MHTWIVQFRKDNGELQSFAEFKARTAAGAIFQAARVLSTWAEQCDKVMDIVATRKE